MEHWFSDVGRPALFEALASACDQIGDDFDTNIQRVLQNNAQLQAELESLRTKMAIVDQLHDENRLLREEVQKLRNADDQVLLTKVASTSWENVTPSMKRTARTPLAPRSANEATTPVKTPSKHGHTDINGLKLSELREEYLRLEGNYNKLYEKYLEALNARTELDHRLREKIKNVEQWMNHANELNAQSQKRLGKVKKLEAQLAAVGEKAPGVASSCSSDVSDSAPTTIGRHLRTLRAQVANRTEGVSSASSRNPSRKSLGLDSTQTPSREHTHEEEGPSLPPLPQDRDGLQNMTAIKNEPSSDTPVVVSERSVRKRRREDEEAEQMPARTRVKTEDGSDPVVFDDRRRFAPQESIDFDAEVSHVQTPRKHRSRFQGDTAMDTPEPPGLQDRSTRFRRQNNQQTPLTEPPGTIAQEPKPAEEDSRPASTRRRRQATATTPSRTAGRPSAVRPLDANVPPSRPNAGSKARSAEPTKIQHGIASLAEDDDQYQASRASRSTSRERRSGRVLNDLLNQPAEQRTSAPPVADTGPEDMPTAAAAQKGFQFTMPPPKHDLPFGKDGRQRVGESLQQAKSPAVPTPRRARTAIQAKSKPSADATAATGEKAISPPPTRTSKAGGAVAAANTERAPLRERALSELRLDDFKVNPAANEGYDYAFTDVVRNHADRASLAGCVREACCGQQFRALARAERATTGPLAFEALLEDHLGADARRLTEMTPQEREALWLDAKTRELANAHGRHRHRYQRMQSPPGFWRTDFPSTQEDQEHRAEGRKMEAEMIQERYREALRPGGRWLFRDE
ncbi:hypothetical protein DL766_004984 [Monosporascus sp. MC13-8B]|uniref:DNA endonuclease activator Ctp1 C-terminal domain-containing protein n=1 Tax=Monosporascus cannonballus TaxID=155416 RepID=A0ABY0H3H0_9PEZI|nr:hypothetical protein DL762_006081 [Monosporascus cannonballus]RYP30250.1 hypothetical protein DL766_004984 [Monosporascus sp. MC13-8B]